MSRVVPWLATASCLLSLACGGSGRATSEQPEQSTIVGRVGMVGNMPFVSPALETDSGEVLILRCDEATERKIRTLQGRRVRISYTQSESTPRGKAVHVVNVEEEQ